MDRFRYADQNVQRHYENWFRWYHYSGGKLVIEQREAKERRQEIINKENLDATNPMIEVWLAAKHTLDPYESVEFQSLIYQSLLDEWGEDSKVFFNLDSVTCKNGKKEKTIGVENEV